MTFLQYLLSNKHKNAFASCMLRTSALTILCKPCCYKFLSIDFLRLRFAKNWHLVRPHPRKHKAVKLVQWKKSYSPLHLSSLGITSGFFFVFFCPWTAGWEAGSRTAGSSILIQELRPELKLIPPWVRPFFLEKLWCWRTCKQLALQGFGAFRRWRALTFLTC